jgi:hypothetical protein
MALPSTYYYNSNALPASPPNADLIREIPTYAIHAMNAGYDQGWESNSVQSKGGFESLAAKINVQVPVHLAMPRPVANRHFSIGKEFSKIAVYAFRPVPSMAWMNGGYMVGATIAIVLKQVKVLSVSPIMQWKGLPALKDGQRNYLEKMFGRETYAAMAVKLFAFQGDVVE